MTTVQRRSAADSLNDARAALGGAPDFPRAEAAFRAALTSDPEFTDAALELAELLQHTGRGEDAVATLAPFVQRDGPEHRVLIGYAEALRNAGRQDEAALVYRRALADFPTPLAEHNLAAVLGDLAQFEEAEALSAKALAAGLMAPQTLMIRARALQGLGRLEESEATFRQVLSRKPTDPDAWRELIQLIWMRTADLTQALAPLDQVMRSRGPDPRLLEIRAVALKYCGEEMNALQTIDYAAGRFPADSAIRVFAAHMSIRANRFVAALAHAEAAVAAQPSLWTRLSLAEALLAAGDASRAGTVLEALRNEVPNDQMVIAYQALAWRLQGDERYAALFDYSSFVSAQELNPPRGWRTLASFLSDLRSRLEDDHRKFSSHPFLQSLLHGSQVNNLLGSRDPVMTGLFEALAEPIHAHVSRLGTGPDPLRSRNTGKTRFEGAWSVRLQGGRGHHIGHVHQKGWLSSACYIALPGAVTASEDRAGWLKFGEPGIKTTPQLAPEHFIKPEEGKLVLFPSYMWHGTEPFGGSETRLSVAFDLLPA
jgi:uncharacterized protein (TIGR02466 family)